MTTGAPRLEALLVGLILLAAAGVALAAAYLPAVPPRPTAPIAQATLSERPGPPPAIATRTVQQSLRTIGLVMLAGAIIAGVGIAFRQRVNQAIAFFHPRRPRIHQRNRHVPGYLARSGEILPNVRLKLTMMMRSATLIDEYPFALRFIDGIVRQRSSGKTTTTDTANTMRQHSPQNADAVTPSAIAPIAHELYEGEESPGISEHTREDASTDLIGPILTVYERQRMRSAILLVEGGFNRHGGWACLTIEPHPAETALLTTLPDEIQESCGGIRAHWRRAPRTHPQLIVEGRLSKPVITDGAYLLPVARRAPRLRRDREILLYLPLRTWPSIGLYGDLAVETFNAALIGLLYAESPTALAVTIIDQGAVRSLYAGAPHVVTPAVATGELLPAITRALRRTHSQPTNLRPLLLALIEPDEATLGNCAELAARLKRHPDAPIYLLLIQTRPTAMERRVCAAIPAVNTFAGNHPPVWRPWMEGAELQLGNVRINAPGLQRQAHAYRYDSAHVGACLAPLHSWPNKALPPTILNLT